MSSLSDLTEYLTREVARQEALGASSDPGAHAGWTDEVLSAGLPGALRAIDRDAWSSPHAGTDLAPLFARLIETMHRPTLEACAVDSVRIIGLAAAGRGVDAASLAGDGSATVVSIRTWVEATRTLAEVLGRDHPVTRRVGAHTVHLARLEVRRHGIVPTTREPMATLLDLDWALPPLSGSDRGLGADEAFFNAAMRGDVVGALLRSLRPTDVTLTRVLRRGTAWTLVGTVPDVVGTLDLWVGLGDSDGASGAAPVHVHADTSGGLRWSARLPTDRAEGRLLLHARTTNETASVNGTLARLPTTFARGNSITTAQDGGVELAMGRGPVARLARRAARRIR